MWIVWARPLYGVSLAVGPCARGGEAQSLESEISLKKKKKHQLIVRDDPVLSHGRARAHLHLHLPLSLPLTNCALPGVEVGLRRSVGDYSEETKGKRQPSGVACRVNGCDHRKTAALELPMDMGAKYSVVTHRTTSGYTYCISHPIYPV